MSRPLIQIVLDRLDLHANIAVPTVMVLRNTHPDYLEMPINIKRTKTPIPKPCKSMYKTKRGKWINYK